MEHTNNWNFHPKSAKIRRLQNNVKNIRENAEVGVKYMQLWEEFALERSEASAEGLIEGYISSLTTILNELGTIPEDIRKKIESETATETLQAWIKIAVKSKSVSEFAEMIEL